MSDKNKKIQTRSRNRNVEVDSSQRVISAELKSQARQVFVENREMNAHKREHDKARKALYKGMKGADVTGFTIKVDDSKVKVEVVKPDSSAIDVQRLNKLVTPEQFLRMVTISQAKVAEVVGTEILNQCLVVTPQGGIENVKVKAV